VIKHVLRSGVVRFISDFSGIFWWDEHGRSGKKLVTLFAIIPAPTEDSCVNIAPPMREIFTACEEFNEAIILTADIQ
jgi:hypothetical protein